MMMESDHLFQVCNGTGTAMKWPSSQLTGFITRVVNPSQTLVDVIDAEVVVLELVQVLSVIHDADAVRLSARSGVGAVAHAVDRRGSSVGVTPSPAVKRRCGIRLDP